MVRRQIALAKEILDFFFWYISKKTLKWIVHGAIAYTGAFKIP